MKRFTRSKLIRTAVFGATSVLALTGGAASAVTSAKLAVSSTKASSTTSSSTGYYVVGSNGGATGFGSTPNGSSINGSQSNVVAAAANPTGAGYWTVTSSGQVVAHAGATFYGSTYTYGITGLSGSHPLNAPIVGIAATANGQGYWLVAADGGVFDFGNAQFHGSTYTYGITGLSGSHPLNAPIVGIVGTPSGSGYWLVAADGGVFDFGSAKFYGSTYSYGITGLSGTRPLDAPIVGAVAAPDGSGYYLVAADGGVFDFGSAKFSGSTYDLGYTGLRGSHPLPGPITDIMPNPTGQGYYVVCKTGNVLAIGGAPSLGNAKVGHAVAIIPSVPVYTGTPQPRQRTPAKTPTPSPQYVPPTRTTTPSPQYVPPAPQSTPLALDTTSLSVSNNSVNAHLSATGGDGGYTFTSTNLPAGLTLSSSGLLTGTLTNTSTTTLTFSVRVTDVGGALTTGMVSLVDSISGSLAITSTTLSTYANVNLQLRATGGSGYSWSSSSMPSGLTLAADGAITGTLGGLGSTSYHFPVTVTDSVGNAMSTMIDLTYNPVQLTTPTVDFTVGQAGSVTLGTNVPGPYSFGIATGTSLPSGLTLSAGGVLSGTPATTDPPSTLVTIYVIDGTHRVGSGPLTVSITDPTGTATSVPIVQTQSANWAGIVDSGSSTTSVSGSFVVPTLASAQSSSCVQSAGECAISEWVGIDGYGNSYLLQAGVQATWSPGTGATYSPWYELLTPSNPEPEEPIPGWSVVNPGDSITVTLKRMSSGNWDILLEDLTTGQSFNSNSLSATALASAGQNNPANFSASSASPENAEWIAETPNYGGTYAALPTISAGGNFTTRTLTIGTVSGSYAVTRSCSGVTGMACMTPTSDSTSPTNYGSFFNLDPFGFSW